MTLSDSIQLLGNLGEFFGSIAVVVTLVYLAVQTRGARAQAESELFNAVLSNRVRVEAILLDHVDFWIDANTGRALNAAESFLFDRLIMLLVDEHFFGYRRTQALGTGRESIHSITLAIMFNEHPVAFARWQARQARVARARSAGGRALETEFKTAVINAVNAMAPVFEKNPT